MTVPVVIVVTGPPGTGKSTIAEHIGRHLGVAVIGWDWIMGGIAHTPEMISVLRSLDRDSYVDLGWSVMANLATAHLRAGRSIVLDGVARQRQLDVLRELAHRENSEITVVVTFCEDRAVHEGRLTGRQRRIPGWHELEWSSVETFLDRWDEPEADLRLDAATSLDENVDRLIKHILPQTRDAVPSTVTDRT